MSQQSLVWLARPNWFAVSLCVLIPLATACDRVPGLSSAASLARKGDARACIHQETVKTAEAVIRGHPGREPSLEEVEALAVSMSGTVMLASDDGVSVTCETTVSITGRTDSTFTYMVVPAADGGNAIQLRWPNNGNEALGQYSAAQWNWEKRAVASPAQTQPEPDSAPPSATTQVGQPISARQVSMIREWADASSNCRGGSDDAQAAEHCAVRDELDSKLVSSGLCFGREGEYEVEYEWHHCDATSMR